MLPSNWLDWVNFWSSYGWFLLLPLIERAFPARPIGWVHRGILSDVIHTYEPILRPACVLFGLRALEMLMPGLGGGAFGIPQAWPLWVHIITVILVSEVSFYAVHRLTHASSFLWEFHRVHHSSTCYQSLMTSRFHPIDSMLFTAPYIFSLHLLGISEQVVFWFGVFQSFMDRYGHSNIDGPRWTGYFITTPHFHAWHHSTDPRAHNRNFGRDFVFMDYLLGSAFYPANETAREFGEPGYPSNIVHQWVRPFVEIFALIRGSQKRLARREQA